MWQRTRSASESGPSVWPGVITARPTMFTLVLLLTMSLAGCSFLGGGDGTDQARDAGSTATPAPTVTPAPWMGAPHTTPPGWQVYHAPDFALALPADWWVRVNVGFDGKLPTRRITYILYSPEDDLRGSVDVFDQLTPAQFHDGFCAPMADQQADTFAGLPMRYTTGDGSSAAFERIWSFASDRGIVYQLLTNDGPNGAVERDAQNRAVLETFAPRYATWGCG